MLSYCGCWLAVKKRLWVLFRLATVVSVDVVGVIVRDNVLVVRQVLSLVRALNAL